MKAHALRASKAKQRKARKKSREGREKRNVEVFDYPRREGIDDDMARDQGSQQNAFKYTMAKRSVGKRKMMKIDNATKVDLT